MERYFDLLCQTTLFSNIARKDILRILNYTGARTVSYQKNEAVIHEGSVVSEVGIALSGSARSVKLDKSGKELIITLLGEGAFIGVLLAADGKRKSPVSIKAIDSFDILFIPFEKMLETACPCCEILMRNCFASVAEKSMMLYDRIECLIRPSVREKIASYLTRLAQENNSSVFTVPMDRNAMAEYLNVDRSALSRELSKMKMEGLLDYYKSSFRLLSLQTDD